MDYTLGQQTCSICKRPGFVIPAGAAHRPPIRTIKKCRNVVWENKTMKVICSELVCYSASCQEKHLEEEFMRRLTR